MLKKSFRGFFTAKNIAYLGVLLALVLALQICAGFGLFRVGPTSLSFVLVPIVLGAILLGPWAGAFLGFVFGVIVVCFGVSGVDAFTAILLGDHPILTTFTCLVKGTAAGLVPGLLYRPIAKWNGLAATFIVSALAPILNTGIFILGALTMSGTLIENFVGDGSLMYFLIVGCAGWNFLIEFAISLLLSPALYRVVRVVEKQLGEKRRNRYPVAQENTTEVAEQEANTEIAGTENNVQ